jgi:DNA-binding ferritin-like protein
VISLQTSRRTDDTLREILKSSKVTESTTTQTIPQFLDIIKTQLTQGVFQRTKEVLPTFSREDQEKVRSIFGGIISEISKTLESIKQTPTSSSIASKVSITEKKHELALPEGFSGV